MLLKLSKFIKREVTALKWTGDDVRLMIRTQYRSILYDYQLEVEKMSIEDLNSVRRYMDGTHRLFFYLDEDKQIVKFETSKRIVVKGVPIMKYVEKEYDPITYINYFDFKIATQLDGMTTIVGMSGAGKTYSALRMLNSYSIYFDKIAYLNYELTQRDIVGRFKEMYADTQTRERVLDKLYMKEGIMSSLELDEILQAMDVMPGEKVVFIVDNVGSVIGQGDNVYHKQNEFLKHLDVICKERGFHALALTQTVKDHSLDLFDENGEIKGSVNMSIMSGSIMLGNLSRSVLFTGYNGTTQEFKQKVLKKGTGKYYSDKGVSASETYQSI